MAVAQRACSAVISGHVQLTPSQPHPSVALWWFLKTSRKRDARENIWLNGKHSVVHVSTADSHVQNTPAAQVAAFVHLTSVVSRFFKLI